MWSIVGTKNSLLLRKSLNVGFIFSSTVSKPVNALEKMLRNIHTKWAKAQTITTDTPSS